LSSIDRNLSSQFVTRIVKGCRTDLLFSTLPIGSNARPFIGVRNHESPSREKRFALLSRPSDIRDLSVEPLHVVPKAVLLRTCGDYVHYVWDKLPEHIKADPKVQTYRRCYEHYNQPWQETHIDGPTPLIKNCSVCQRK